MNLPNYNLFKYEILTTIDDNNDNNDRSIYKFYEMLIKRYKYHPQELFNWFKQLSVKQLYDIYVTPFDNETWCGYRFSRNVNVDGHRTILATNKVDNHFWLLPYD